MVAIVDIFGLPSTAYVKGFMACEQGYHKLCNPYSVKTRNNNSWNMGFEDAEDLIYGKEKECQDAAECA